MLTIHLVTKNNESTLERALESLMPLSCPILVGDYGSNDQTITIAEKYGCKVYRMSWGDDFSGLRNKLVEQSSTDWQFYLEPWEAITSGHELLLEKNDRKMANCMVLYDDLLTKQVRLWRKSSGAKFIRPVYESLDPEYSSEIIPVMIYAEPPNTFSQNMELLKKWREREPMEKEIDYYMACAYLAGVRYDDFLRVAEHYLFSTKTANQSVIMTKYYCALVQCHIKRNPYSAMNYILPCIGVKPLTAEFWCTLGDIYFFGLRQKEVAKIYYENAIMLGKYRNQSDLWPVELPKYGSYPRAMIEYIKKSVELQM